jgi:polar amino acid transport system substrate-binding protein
MTRFQLSAVMRYWHLHRSAGAEMSDTSSRLQRQLRRESSALSRCKGTAPRDGVLARPLRALIVALVFGWAGLCFSQAAGAETTLRLATDVWLPYEDISDKNSPGFSTEVIAHVLKSMNVKTDTREFPWARAMKEVFDGNRDALYTAFWTEDRAKFCLYPEEPLTRDKWVFFVRRANAASLSIASYEDLKDRRIGILRGASITKEFWDIVRRHKNYEVVKTDELNFRKLARGRLDYVVTSYSNGINLLKKMKLSDKISHLASPVIKEDNLYIIFSRKTVKPEFVARFSAALKAFKKTDTHRAIHQKYFGRNN